MAFPKRFSAEEIAYMQKLRSEGMSYRAIGRHMKADDRTVRRAIQGYTKVERSTKYVTGMTVAQMTMRDQAEKRWREVRHTIPTPKTLNQLLLGDPPAGRSALDKKRMNDGVEA